MSFGNDVKSPPSLTTSSNHHHLEDISKEDSNSVIKTETTEDDWDTDPANARNWPQRKKWTATAIVSLYTFVAPLGSSMMAPGLPDVAIKYGITNPTVLALTLSIYLVSFAIGVGAIISPLFLAPLSEMYGRTWVYHIGNLITVGLNLGCAFAPTTGSLIGLRFLAGFSGSASIAIGGGSVGDLFAERDRATAMALYTLGPLFGPVIGPIAGGFIVQSLGVKWVFIMIALICGAVSVIGIPLLRETYAPIIQQRQAAKSGNMEKAVCVQPAVLHEHGKLYFLWINLSRPIGMLFGSLICFVLSLYMAFIYGIYYLMFATFSDIFSEKYHFSIGTAGLAYVGIGVGFLTAMVFGVKFSDRLYKRLADKNGGVGKPEMRIPSLFIASLLIPISLFWYGWSADAGIHWIMPIIGTAFFGFGMMSTYLPVQLYLVDSFTYAASVTSGAAFFRSLLGFAFPLFSGQMFAVLGLGGGNSLLAGLAIVLGIPFPIWLYFRGEEMRARNPLTYASTVPKSKLSPSQ